MICIVIVLNYQFHNHDMKCFIALYYGMLSYLYYKGNEKENMRFLLLCTNFFVQVVILTTMTFW
jgi:hypothetical protein